MKKRVIFCILIMLLNCEKKQRSLEYQIGDIADDLLDSGAWSPVLLACGGNVDITSYTEFIDMNDGTIKKQDYSHSHDNCYIFPDSTTYSNIYYIKKCLQGQVYRPAQNDCQGTGTAPDWGAVKYQFCPTNDRACEMIVQDEFGANYYVADPTISPAAKACDLDATAGRKWRMFIYQTDAGKSINNVDYRIYYPDIPTGSLYTIWREADSSNIETADTTYIDPATGGRVRNGYVFKSTSHYVQCISNQMRG